MNGTLIAYNLNKPQPVKQKIRYHTAVTVCIAVICQERGERRIVLCSDSRLDYAELGSTNTSCKLDVLGYGWCAQLAGEWSGVNYFWSLFKESARELSEGFTSVTEVESHAKSVTARFLKSDFCKPKEVYELLLSGFIGEVPILFTSSVFDRAPRRELRDSFAAVGYGSSISSVILTLRECHSKIPLSYAAYLTYEAKRASEKTGFVGKFTTLAVQAPPLYEDSKRAWVKIVSDVGKANLEKIYRNLWNIPIVDLPDLTDDFFIDPTKKQSPE